MSLYPEGPIARAAREMSLLGGAREMAERDLGRRHGYQEAMPGEGRELPCSPEQIPDWLAKEAAEKLAAAKACHGAVGLQFPDYLAREADKARAEQLAKLRDRRRVYIEYARHRIDDEDWHGVSDAANDLRELDVEIRMLEDRR